MDMGWIALSGAVIIVLAAFGVMQKRRGEQLSSLGNEPLLQTQAVVVPAVEVGELEPPVRLVLAVADEPAFILTMLDDAELIKDLGGLTRCDPSAFGRALEPLMQLAPCMATAAMAGDRQLMEVVINGPLVAAADGSGFRAMTMGADGVQQNARLFEPRTLQNVANAAAMWQLASVAVAQKHLADISATLERLEDKVSGIQFMLEEDRAALIGGAIKYMHSARHAMQQGEFLDRTRDKLEDFEIQLERAGTTLLKQIERETDAELQKDMVGCEGEYKSALIKHKALAFRAAELGECAEVRLANWYLCSLYPDRSKMLETRMQHIQQFMTQVARMQERLRDVLDEDCQKIAASFTFDETIDERRRHVRNEAKKGDKDLNARATRCTTIIARVQSVADDRASTSRLLIETNGKVATAIYLTLDAPKLPQIRVQNEDLIARL